MIKIEDISKENSRIVNLAINYGGRSEIVNAYNQLLASGKKDITEDDVSGVMYTKNSPELDMIIRTGGDIRISNFLLWQAAYSEFWFSDINWPSFSEKDMEKAIIDYQQRNRRFGKV